MKINEKYMTFQKYRALLSGNKYYFHENYFAMEAMFAAAERA